MAEPIDLAQAFDQASKDQFWAVRGLAIQAYANLEQSLCRLFGLFAGVTPDVAGVIFFKITSVRVIEEIVDKLLRKKHGTTYAAFS
jgi:hypothetical protein